MFKTAQSHCLLLTLKKKYFHQLLKIRFYFEPEKWKESFYITTDVNKINKTYLLLDMNSLFCVHLKYFIKLFMYIYDYLIYDVLYPKCFPSKKKICIVCVSNKCFACVKLASINMLSLLTFNSIISFKEVIYWYLSFMP